MGGGVAHIDVSCLLRTGERTAVDRTERTGVLTHVGVDVGIAEHFERTGLRGFGICHHIALRVAVAAGFVDTFVGKTVADDKSSGAEAGGDAHTVFALGLALFVAVFVEHKLVGVIDRVETVGPPAPCHGVHHIFALAEFTETVAARTASVSPTIGEQRSHRLHDIHVIFYSKVVDSCRSYRPSLRW